MTAPLSTSETGNLVGPVEGPACPGCGLMPLWDKPWDSASSRVIDLVYDGHFEGCPAGGTCGQIGPPWPPRELWHPEADWLGDDKWTTEALRAHLATHPKEDR